MSTLVNKDKEEGNTFTASEPSEYLEEREDHFHIRSGLRRTVGTDYISNDKCKHKST